jgi:uncharacterized protein YndB with AHSA1/START domain
METTKVIQWVDIQAPRQEVFAVVTDIQRRMQLSPLWGVTQVESQSEDYPAVGSTYCISYVDGVQPSYNSVVIDFQPQAKLAYCLDHARQTNISWTLQDVKAGTRLSYCEEFQLQEGEGDEFTNSVRIVIQQWLQNIQRYAELRNGWGSRMLQKLADRFYLRLRPDQRRVILTMLFINAVGFIAFVMAAIAMGFASIFL